MQAISLNIFYDASMAKVSSLKSFREAAGISQRELARQIGQDASNIRYWENSGNLPRSDVLIPMAKALGVTIEELLGEARPRRAPVAGGRMGQVFQRAGQLSPGLPWFRHAMHRARRQSTPVPCLLQAVCRP